MAAKPMKSIPETGRIVLCQALAREQAPWLPIGPHLNKTSAIYARRTGAVPITAARGRAADRESNSYWRGELAAAGLISGQRLTTKGKLLTRSWTWPYVASELRLCAKRLLAAIAREDYHPDSGDELRFVPVSHITGDFYSRQTEEVHRCFTPWLADRVLISATDAVGCVFYSPANTIVDLIKLATKVIDSRVDFDLKLADVYDAELSRARNQMLTDSRYYSEIGQAPLALMELVSHGRTPDIPRLKPIFKVDDELAACTVSAD